MGQVALFDVAVLFEVEVMSVEERSSLDILGHHHHWLVLGHIELLRVERV